MVPAFDLGLRLRMLRRAANRAHLVVCEPVSEVARDIARAVIGQQSRLMNGIGLVAARRLQGKLQGLGHIAAGHGGAQLPRAHVAGEVIQYRGPDHPAPTADLQVREAGLPELIDGRGLVFELIGSLHNNEGRTGNQIMGLEKPVYRALRNKITLGIRERYRSRARAPLRSVQSPRDQPVADLIGATMPRACRPWRFVCQGVAPLKTVTLLPAVEWGSRHTEHGQCLLGAKVRALHKSDDLKLLAGRVSHSSSSPSLKPCFF